MGLRKGQRNEIFRAVERAGFSPEEFDWALGADESTLRYRPSGAYFVFGGVAGAYVSRYLVDRPELFDRVWASESQRRSGISAWVSGATFVDDPLAGEGPVEERTGLSQYRLMQQVEIWLMHVKLDSDTPDLWAQLQGEAELLGAVFDEATENTPLTSAEQQAIAGQLRELRDYVSRTYSLSEAQTRLLEEKLDDLAAATGRVGRKDWLLMAAGLMLSYVLGAALPSEAARDILVTLLTSIGHILGSGPLGLPGG